MMTPLDQMLLGAAILAGVFFAVSFVRKRFAKRPQPSDFAVCISRSMTHNADDWDYDLKENWLLNRVANLALNLQPAAFGDVDTLQSPNSGTQTIEKLRGIDKDTVETAYGEWKVLTALNRRHVAERRKRDAMTLLGN